MSSQIVKDQKSRPPVVVVLGHVDHGKTSLLDYLRKTSVVKREKGGITQSIGASVIRSKDGHEMTFIDTPGHAAFTKMRGRGAKLADVAILIVAGDDGVKPQTKEALEIILSENLPFVVAITKIDLPNSSIPNIQSQLESCGVYFEGRGGEVPCIGISNVSGAGIDELLEVINLVSELKNVSGDSLAPLEAVVIETAKDKAGPKASIVVRNGTLRVGEDIVSETVEGRIRAIFDDSGSQVKEIHPGYPASILGLPELPPVGSRIWQKKAGAPVAIVDTKETKTDLVDTTDKLTVLIKTHNEGTREAILASLPENTFVISSGVGDVTESDIFVAKSASARIFTFEAKTPNSVVNLARTEGIRIESFGIIYELINRIEELISGGKDEELGKANILATFPFNNKIVCGVKVTSGKLTKGDKVILMDGENKKGELKIISMRRGKNDINEAKQGEECGVICVPQLDFTIGSMLISVRSK